jgi:hypothetical protein
MKFYFSAIAFSLAFASAIANAKNLYQTDFDTSSSPTYSTVFGKPEIVGPNGIFETNSLAFNCSHSLNLPSHNGSEKHYYDQIEYRIDQQHSPFQGMGKSAFKVSFDMLTRGLVGSYNNFNVIFDAPSVISLVFSGEGNVYAYGYKVKPGPIYKFSDDQRIHVDIDFDINKDIWKIQIDEKTVFSGLIGRESLRSIRFSLGPWSAGKIDFGATTYIDNVLISIEDSDDKPKDRQGNS